jgi:hypothetical protein
MPALYKGLAYESGKDIILHNNNSNHNMPGHPKYSNDLRGSNPRLSGSSQQSIT